MPGIASLAIFLALGIAGCGDTSRDPETAVEPAASTLPEYAGTLVCGECHAEQLRAWTGSHHDLAMQSATGHTVLGDFNAASFEHLGVTSRFERRDGNFYVTTDGADGTLAEFPVRYTFGVYPLQQYLAELPGGRIQALPLAWDTRPAADGGQRWFHVYGDEPIDHRDVLHWTRLSQNWETQCADCHSTALQSVYDVDNDRFQTSWAEINVACEACHGPASQHVAWARNPDSSPQRGLVLQLDERAGINWVLDPATGNSRRSAARETSREIDTCAPCHSRRARISKVETPGGEFLDSYQPAFIDPPLYQPDGQVRDEVYVYGSFLQSRMYQQGVTCSDCHEPHSLQLRAPGPQVCAQCHDAGKYATTGHHLHKTDSAGANCIECHMPPTTFMQVDARHDHSFRIPRPHLAVEFGTPVSCTVCHADRDAAWAAGVLDRAGKTSPVEPVHWSRRLTAAERLPLESRNLLLGLAADASVPAIIRASAMGRLDLGQDSLGVAVIGERLQSPDPMLRLGAARALQTASPAARVRLAPALLDDPVKAVRMTTVMTLAPLGPEALPVGVAARFKAVIDEYFAAQLLNVERAESHTNIGNVQRHLGRPDLAEAAYRTALKVNDQFVPAYVNLADLYRERGRETDADTLLRAGLEKLPGDASLRHALGLSLVRQGRMDAAAEELKAAAEAEDSTPRFALAYGLVLDAQGFNADARAYLEQALQRYPDDPTLIASLAGLYQRAGDLDRARDLAALLPR